ncbi:YesL family protein [Bifidobacterium sp.]|jgi:uncharacterized membrane protein YesL|uniref:YesL family protein n=1 Tax=Bifidobacterium sp. TaxID=41200 RepID=UPI0025C000FD|nr:YesL family protein [Bifidobacterium sp.]MCH4209419.1 YesL family protein [Bifidobacterium sp.]MCI1224997.1 YesL family protein [Bifidobacterium sp.]
MRSLRPGSVFDDFMSRIGDLAMLNVAWAVCCLPFVTIGASTGAMYEVIRSLHEGDDAHVLRQFFRAFKRRFGTSLALTLIMLAVVALAAFDLWYTTKLMPGADMASLSWGVIVTLSLMLSAGAGFIFPVMSRSKLTIWAQIRQSFAVALHHPFTAVSILALDILPFAIATFAPGGLPFVVFFWGLLFTAASAYLVIGMMLRNGIIQPKPLPRFNR